MADESGGTTAAPVQHDSTGSAEPELFAAVLRRTRKNAGLSQVELAIRAGRAPTTVAKLEVGMIRPSVGMIIALANVLGVSQAELFGAGFDATPRDLRVSA